MQKSKKSISIKKVIKLIAILIVAIYIAYATMSQAFVFVTGIYHDLTSKEIENQADLIKVVSEHIKVPDTAPSFTYKVTEENLPGVLERLPFLEGVEKDNYIVSYPGLFIVYDIKKDILIRVVGGMSQQ